MSTWEYRIYEEAGYLRIIEVYLDANGNPTGYGEAKIDGYETVDQLCDALQKMLDAVGLRTMIPKDLEKEAD